MVWHGICYAIRSAIRNSHDVGAGVEVCLWAVVMEV
jgi:hypothetical protein